MSYECNRGRQSYGSISQSFQNLGNRKNTSRYQIPKSLCHLMLILVALIPVMASMSVLIRYNVYNDGELVLSPGDTQLYPISGFFCGSATLSVNGVYGRALTTTMYHLNAGTPTVTMDRFALTSQLSLTNSSFRHWSFYLRKDSIVHLDACTENSKQDYVFIVLQGDNNFKFWTFQNFFTGTYDAQMIVNGRCESSNSTLSYIVSLDDQYYFVNYCNNVSKCQLKQSLYFDRYIYTVPQTAHQCSFDYTNGAYNTCTISINFGFSNALILVATEKVEDMEARVNVGIACQPQVLGYIIAFVLPILLVFLVFVVYWVVSYKTHSGTIHANELTRVLENQCDVVLTRASHICHHRHSINSEHERLEPPPPYM